MAFKWMIFVGITCIQMVRCSEPKFIVGKRAPFGRTAIVIYPFIVVDSTIADSSTYKHEMAHWDQIQRMGPIGFYTCYFLNWLWLQIRYPMRNNYPYIKYEIEAVKNE